MQMSLVYYFIIRSVYFDAPEEKMEQQGDSMGLYKMQHMPFVQKQITDYYATH
jgi:hypothetical protein